MMMSPITYAAIYLICWWVVFFPVASFALGRIQRALFGRD